MARTGEIRGPATKPARAARTTCSGTTRAGKPCPAPATNGAWCYWHDPNVSDEVKRAARQRGRAAMVKARTPVSFTKADFSSEESARRVLEEAADLVRQGRLPVSVANAVTKMVAAAAKLGELKLAARLHELEERLRGAKDERSDR